MLAVCSTDLFATPRPRFTPHPWRSLAWSETTLRGPLEIWHKEVMDPAVAPVRSRLMSRIRRAHTKPERDVRSLLHRLGYRYRIQLKGVPSRPDVAFPRRQMAILVHGCFWHQHQGCHRARLPATRRDFWRAKFEKNIERDARLQAAAEAQGWSFIVIWECETEDIATLGTRLVRFLGPTRWDSGRAC